MKTNTLTLLTLFLCSYLSLSQDIITKKNGDDIQAKVLEITKDDVKYNRFDNLSGPIYTLPKVDILMILYENGTKDIFIQELSNEKVLSLNQSTEDLFIRGQQDASKYYTGYKRAGTGTLMTGLVSPLVGLIPAIASSSTPPKDSNLNYPDTELMKNSDYYNGYTQKAKKIKQGKVWKNWGIALGVNLVAVLVITSSQ